MFFNLHICFLNYLQAAEVKKETALVICTKDETHSRIAEIKLLQSGLLNWLIINIHDKDKNVESYNQDKEKR